MTSPTIPNLKARLRDEALARRDALDPEWCEKASHAMAERALALPELRDRQPVSGFWPIRSEIDVRILMQGLHARGQALCLPVVAKPAMIFRSWAPGDPLERSSFGVDEPPPSAPTVLPAALLVPLAAFDRRGWRIGYGRAHFDTVLAALEKTHPVLAVGVGFSTQEVAEVPREPHDRRLDVIVTDTETIRISGESPCVSSSSATSSDGRAAAP
jgi:5-formyltetrahydrofolate cyclo-ligase